MKLIKNNVYIIILYLMLIVFIIGSKLYFRVQDIDHSNARTHPITVNIKDAHTDENDVPVFWELADNQQFLYVTVAINNNKDEVYELSPISSMSLYSVEEQMMYEVSGAPYAPDAVGGPLQANQNVMGTIPFTVTKGYTDYILYVQPYGVDAQLQWFYVTL